MIEIRPLELEDCYAVAKTHINYLNTPFRGNGGIQLLRVYYEAIASQMGGIGFIAFDDLNVAGFVCGIWDRQAIKRSLMKKWYRLIIYGVRQSLQAPKIVSNLLLRVINPTLTYIKTEGYELRPLIVLPHYRGHGIADGLVLRLVEDAKQRGFVEIFLLVDSDNVAAVKFYARFGFKCRSQISMSGRAMNSLHYSFVANNL